MLMAARVDCDWKVTVVKLLHPENALVPIVITEEGMSIEAKLVHHWKV